MYKAVIFDMDGLLLDTERVALMAGAEACAEMGYDLPHEFFLSLVGIDQITGEQRLRERLGDFDRAELDRRWQASCERAFAGGISLRPRVGELLDLLDGMNVARAIATSSQTKRAWAKLDGAGIRHRFNILVGFDDVTAPKPAPEPYLRAANLLNVSPADCLVFEDSDTGVRAAHAAGMRVVQVPDMSAPQTDLAHHVAEDIMTGARLAGLIP